MKQYEIPILLEFFARPNTFRQVFESIRKIKPKYLYLYQDGIRGEKDFEGHAECRKIVSSIDWLCEVKTFYQEKNQGCDPSGYIAQSWFFKNVEYGIVLEDDCVPNESFFRYCEELLIKYKDDEGIAFICGMNVLDEYENQNDKDTSYFFTAHGGIWGWASWKRFYEKCDPAYSWLENEDVVKKIKQNFSSKYEANQFIKLAKQRRKEGKEYFETIVYANARMHNQLEIVPTKNLISNIGIGGGTHSTDSLEGMHPNIRKLFNKKTYELPSPLKHPSSKERNTSYEKEIEPSFKKEFSYKLYRLKYRLKSK